MVSAPRQVPLHGTAHPGRRRAGCELDRGVEVVGLEEEVAAEGLLDGDERPVRGQRRAVLHRTVVAVSGGCIWTRE